MFKVFITGNLVRDPELRTTPDGQSVCNFTVATSTGRRSKNNQQQNGQRSDVEFVRVTAWRQLGENCARFLTKGRHVSVIGSLTTSNYQNKQGENQKSLDCEASDVDFGPRTAAEMENAPAASAAKPAPAAQPVAPAPQGSGFVEVDEEDLPF